jgi:ribosomal protein S18 acetylase RimI-like enzyme
MVSRAPGGLVSRRLANLTLDNLDDLPRRCRRCVFWELDPIARQVAEESGDPELEKEAWLSATLLDWGSCGKIVYVDSLAAGYVLYAPPAYVPRSLAFPTSPVAADAVQLITATVLPEFTGGGLGRMLVQGAAKDLSRRGIKAIEAFGDARADSQQPGPPGSCLVPADYLLAVGFKTVRPHHRFPRLRLDLKNAVSWREDVEVALERLLGSMNPEPVFRPV